MSEEEEGRDDAGVQTRTNTHPPPGCYGQKDNLFVLIQENCQKKFR